MQTGSESVTPTGSTAAATPVATNPNPTRMAATAPGQLRVIKRNGTVVPFEAAKFRWPLPRPSWLSKGALQQPVQPIHETVAKLTEQVTATFQRRMPSGGTIHIEDIQDQVELALMRAGEHKIARDYVIYRESGQERAAQSRQRCRRRPQQAANAINVVQADGSRAPLDIERIQHHRQRGLRGPYRCQRERDHRRGPAQLLRRRLCCRGQHCAGHYRAHADRTGAQLQLRRGTTAV
jgi:ribonucleoside-diphosphate reductase alpha chain